LILAEYLNKVGFVRGVCQAFGGVLNTKKEKKIRKNASKGLTFGLPCFSYAHSGFPEEVP
jgi:hypothetical protein